MRAALGKLLKAIAAEISQGGISKAIVDRSLLLLRQLPFTTEADRQLCISTQVEFLELFLGEESVELTEDVQKRKRALEAELDRMYGRPDSPHWRVQRLVQEAAEAFRVAEDSTEPTLAAGAAIRRYPLVVASARSFFECMQPLLFTR